MKRTMTTALAAVSMAVLPFATASAQEPAVTADVDGDGRPDPVSLQQVDEQTMLLRVGLTQEFVDTRVEGSAMGQPLRPTDVNGDGFDEVLVPESVGANTITYSVWGYSPQAGLHPVRTPGGQVLRLFEGGGARAVSGYGCGPAESTRTLVSVNAYATDNELYEGYRDTFSVRAGIATPSERIVIEGAQRTDPRLQVDPGTCAPLG